MKHSAGLIILTLLFSCRIHKPLAFEQRKIEEIEIYQENFKTKIITKAGFEKDFIADIKKSRELAPETAFIKTHCIFIRYADKSIDTINTNGNIHYFKKWYQSDENLIDKYAINQNTATDTITGQIKTVERLKKLMEVKKYEEATTLFSRKQQEYIKKIKKDTEAFKFWCMAWTLDEAQYSRYIKNIKAGKGIFVFEDNQWKIDEK